MRTRLLAGLLLAGVLAAANIQSLGIVIIQGEGSFNDIRRKIGAEIVVEVQDDRGAPVAKAHVEYLLPYSGPGGTFAGGQRSQTTQTDTNGRASSSGFRPNGIEGRFPVKVTASYAGKSATGLVWQSNTLAGGKVGNGGGRGKKLIIIGALGGVAGTVLAVTMGRGSGSTTAPTVSPTVLSLGGVSVGAPR